jgi:hypothetical protein
MIVQNAKYALQEFYIAHIYAGDHEKSAKRTSSMNRPKDVRAQEVAQNFTSCNPFFTVLIQPNHLEANQLVGEAKTQQFYYIYSFMQCYVYIHYIYVML